LYSALIDQTVAHSGKGRSEDLHGTVQRGGEGLRHLLRRTAAMISIFWTERISFEELQARLEECQDLEDWVNSATEGNPLHELVVNFYFKGGHPDLGCEFLHKSFREYLFAEAIVEELLRIADGHEGPLKPPELPYWKDFDPGSLWHTASRALGRLLSPCALTPEVRQHLFWLIEKEIAKQPERWLFVRDLLADVYGWWAEGAHLRLQPSRERGQTTWKAPYVFELAQWALPYKDPDAEPQRTATIDGYLGYALIQLTAWVHSQLRGIRQQNASPRPYQITPQSGSVRFRPGNGYLSNILSRCRTVVMPFSDNYVLPDTWLVDEDLSGAYLVEANLTRANLEGASLAGANMSYARLWNADLRGAHLASAMLQHATLVNSLFNEAYLSSANLSHAQLSYANFSQATADNSDLSYARIEGSSFSQASLNNADFSYTTITHATVLETELEDGGDRQREVRTRLTEAILDGANFSHATLSGVDFSASSLEHTNFAYAQISDSDFSKARLNETRFTHAKLDDVSFPDAGRTGQ
jgi:uncharacterized protein YjbI with pentapeptide repeats